MSIVINTPNGNIGRVLTQTLLSAGKRVRIISRDPRKVADLAERGAEVIEGSADDGAVLDRAFAGASALFWLNLPNITPDFVARSEALGRQAALKARAAGIQRAVVLSSMAAQAGAGVGPVSALLPVETAFRAALPHVATLRPSFFMENLFNDLATVKHTGAIFGPAPANVPVPMVATRDIAHRAAAYLLTDAWAGQPIVGVHGPADVTYEQVVATIGRALGKPVAYHTVTLEQFRGAMLEHGVPRVVADLYTEMYTALLEGRMVAAEPRTPETTTPTTLEQFIHSTWKPAFDAL